MGNRKFNLFGRLIALSIAAGTAILWLAGCAQDYHLASKLPVEYAATSAPSPRDLDLSGLAQSTSRNDSIYPGDVVQISIATSLQQTDEVLPYLRVSQAGIVEEPTIGPLKIGDMALHDAEAFVRQESIRRGYYIEPVVSILVTKRRTNNVTIVGAVKKPGSYLLPAQGSDLLAALTAAEGLAEDAGAIVEIRHPPPGEDAPTADGPSLASFQPKSNSPAGPRFVRIDLLANDGKRLGQDLRLEDGAVVMVTRQAKRSIQVLGLVKESGVFEIEPGKDVYLLDALAMAKGLTMSIADKVHVVRRIPGRDELVVIEASVANAKSNGGKDNILLAPGDVVSVEETPVTFVLDTLRGFIRFGFSSSLF